MKTQYKRTNPIPRRHATHAFLLASTLLIAPLAVAQVDEEEQVFELSPFTVDGSEDTGYRATSTLAGSRIRTDLKDVGSAISVITEQFLEDTNSTNAEALLVYTTGTEVAGQGGNFAGLGDGSILNDGSHVEPVSNTRVRGLASADNLRDFFLSDIPWDTYNINRVDLQRGANSILFGIGSPAGVINSTVNTANFDDANKVEIQVGSFGSYRATVDFNKVVLEDELAVRFSALHDDKKYKQDPAFREDQRAFFAAKWAPKFLQGDSATTTLRANFEIGKIDGINPRLTPPIDAITPWFGAMNKATYPWLNVNEVTTLGHARYSPYVGAAGSRIWDGNVIAFDSPDAASQSLAFVAAGRNYPASDSENNDPSNGSYKGVVTYNNIAQNRRLPGYSINPYKARSLTDPTVFDFYNHLIEGSNRSNSSEFEAYNINLGQTFWNNKAGIEVAFDKQETEWGWKNFLAWDAAAITVDIMETLIDGSPNPNVGRPMIIGGGGSAGSGRTIRDRDSLRATAFVEVDFRDFMAADSWPAKALGRHVFTTSFAEQKIGEVDRSWNNWFVGSGYGPTADVAVGQAGRDATTITYLGPDLRGVSSLSGLNLGRITALQEAESATVMQWNTEALDYVSYDLPIVNPNAPGFSDTSRPYTQASDYIEKIKSEVFVWQAYLFDGNLVPMAGWRKDIDRKGSASAPKIGGIVDYGNPEWFIPSGLDEADPNNGRNYDRVEGDTVTRSIVGHLPAAIADNLPFGMRLSAFYSESSNFQPDAGRKDVVGGPVPSPQGETKDYGITISAFNDRVFLKVNKYETSVSNATLSDELGNAYLIGAGEAWGQAAAYHLGQDDGIWPGDGNFGTTSEGSAFGAGNTLRWQPADTYLIDPDNRDLGYTQVAIDAQYDIQRRSTEDWLSKPVPDNFRNAWGMDGYETGSGSWSMNSVAVTGDTFSEGTEFELVLNPIEGLDVSINASKTRAQRLNLAQAYTDWIEQRYEDYQGPMGDMRLWGNGNWALEEGAGGTVRDKFNNETYPAYKLALALNETDVPELRPWRFNAVANYNFSDGVLSGTNVGLGYRWQDQGVTGFGLNDTLDGYDPNIRFYGPADDAVDLWVGHSRKIFSDSVDWRVQVNVRNAFASKDLIPVTSQPTGERAAYRIPEPRTITLSSSFEF